MAMSGKFRPFA